MNRLLTTIIFFTIAISSAFNQNLVFPRPIFNGTVVKYHEIRESVLDRQDQWNFKQKELLDGKSIEISENGQYKSNLTFYRGGQYNITYELNAKGQAVVGNIKTMSGNRKSNYTYDKKDQLSEVVFENNNQTYRTMSYKYKGSKLVQTILKSIGQNAFESTYTIDNDQIRSEKMIDEKGQLIYNSKYTYNKKGFEEMISFFNASDQLINQQTFEYIYDKKGNWTKCLMTDFQKDERTLFNRTLIYQSKSPITKISKKELEGAWDGYNNDFVIVFKDGKSHVDKEGKNNFFNREYSFNPFSGELSLEMGFMTRRSSYLVAFDGTMLTLHNMENDDILMFKRYDQSKLPDIEKADLSNIVGNQLAIKTYKENELYGLKDLNDQVVLPPIYQSLEIDYGAIKAKKDGKFALLNAKGKPITPFDMDRISLGPIGFHRFVQNNLKGIIDHTGKILVPATYNRVLVITNNLMIVSADEITGLVNIQKNKLLFPLVHTRRSFRRPILNRTTALNRSTKEITWLNGQFEVVKKFTQDQVRKIDPIDLNCFSFQNNERQWGLMDSLGNITMKAQFEKIEKGSHQLMRVSKNGKFGLINTKGEQVAEVIYDRVEMPNSTTTYHSELALTLQANEAAALFIKGEKFGFLDGLGNEKAPKISSLIDYDMFFKTQNIDERIEYKHSTDWKNSNSQACSRYNDIKETNFILTIKTYTGNPESWIDSKHPSAPLKETTVDGKKGWSFVKYSPNGQGKTRTEYIYIPLNSTEIMVGTFACRNKDYHLIAQAFFDIKNTIKILK